MDFDFEPDLDLALDLDFDFVPDFDLTFEPDFDFEPDLDLALEPDFGFEPVLDLALEADFDFEPDLDLALEPDFDFEPVPDLDLALYLVLEVRLLLECLVALERFPVRLELVAASCLRPPLSLTRAPVAKALPLDLEPLSRKTIHYCNGSYTLRKPHRCLSPYCQR